MKFISKLSVILALCLLFSFNGYCEKASDFTLPGISGENISLSSMRGKKVLIDFFATWCPPCRKELKEINGIVSKYTKGNYEILCISVDNSIEVVKKFIKDNDYKMKVLFDDKGVSQEYGVVGVPSLFLVDEKGNIVWKNVGLVSKKELLKVLGLN